MSFGLALAILAGSGATGRLGAGFAGVGDFNVNLESKPHIERIDLYDNGAVLVRFDRNLVAFVPTAYQRRKIRRGKGRLLIAEQQIIRRYY